MTQGYRPLNVPKNVEGRLGITAEEYRARQAAGLKWCSRCKAWHPVEAFHRSDTWPDGLQRHCKEWYIAYVQRRKQRAQESRGAEL